MKTLQSHWNDIILVIANVFFILVSPLFILAGSHYNAPIPTISLYGGIICLIIAIICLPFSIRNLVKEMQKSKQEP